MDDQTTDRCGGESVAPRWSLRRFLAAFALISVGVAAWSIAHEISLAWSESKNRFDGLPVSVAIYWIVAGVTLGAGVFALARRTLLGAMLGLTASGFLAALAMLATK